ncbi:MAG: cytochrome c oxidase subunit II [Candidatus Omnitrophica bacterium]|nr:cytochrome c oxidase subunit II [Candidatus Omnitrophota bacterium]
MSFLKSLPFSGIWYIKPPEDVSLDGYRIDHVIHYTDTVVAIYFSIVVLALIFFIFKYRARKGHKAVYDKGDSPKTIIITVCLGFLVFFSIDAVIETMSFKDLKEAFWNFPKGDDVVKVECLPQQFAWNFRYPGPDGRFATEDDIVPPQNQMHVPVDTPIVVQMAPYDVIHSFYIPNFRLKQDATPGMITTFWFEAKKEGKYEIGCAELCGNSHYRMRGYLTVQSKEDYQKWLAELQAEQEGGDEFDDWLMEDESSDDSGIPQNWGWPWNKKIKTLEFSKKK